MDRRRFKHENEETEPQRRTESEYKIDHLLVHNKPVSLAVWDSVEYPKNVKNAGTKVVFKTESGRIYLFIQLQATSGNKTIQPKSLPETFINKYQAQEPGYMELLPGIII